MTTKHHLPFSLARLSLRYRSFAFSLLLAVAAGPDLSGGIVTTAVDENNVVPGTGLSLREAIAAAVPGETITFAPALNGQTITLVGTADPVSGELTINKDLTIDASALPDGITISGNYNYRVFNITAPAVVVMDSLRIINGLAEFSGRRGAGIRSTGTLTVVRCTVSACLATTTNSFSLGGGIYCEGGLLTVRDSTVNGNTATNGGGISSNPDLVLENSTIADNNANFGGGIVVGGNAVIRTSTITGNNAAYGGAGTAAGGIYTPAAGNTLLLENSIVAGNTTNGNEKDIGGPVTSRNGVNFIGDTVGTSGLGTLGVDYLTGDPLLAPLGDYGGPTPTVILLPGSPAIDAGANVDPGGSDQRGAPRLVNGALDIGAVETQERIVTTVVDEDDLIPGAGLSLREAIANQFAAPESTITFAPGLDGQTITLGGNQMVIDNNLTIDALALPDGLTISGNNASRLFLVSPGVGAVFRGLSLTGGSGLGSPLSGYGAALFNEGTLTLERCWLWSNAAFAGGAIFNGSTGSLLIADSTISENTASYGGAIQNEGALEGSNSTMALNTGSVRGGAISVAFNGSIDLDHCTVVGNSSSEGGGVRGNNLTFNNSIVANNTALTDPDVTGGFSGSNNLIGVNPQLSALGDYGGPTPTMRPLAGSPALDAAGPSALALDQRGLGRPVGGSADLGAVEVQSSAVQVLDGELTLRPTFTWTAPNATSAEFYLGTEEGSLGTLGTATSPFTPASPLAFATTYYWRVDFTIGGVIVPGEVLSFTTRSRDLVVDTLEDESDGVALGGISLRDALAEAVDADPPETITFAPALAADTIILGGIPLVIDTSLVVDATSLAGGITISGNNLSRVLEVSSPGGNVELKNLTIRNGAGFASGIFLRSGMLRIVDSTITANVAGGGGGGIRALGSTVLEVFRSTISGNTASRGGGIFALGAQVSVDNSTVSGNSAIESGGGIHLLSSSGDITNTTISGNTAGDGGGIHLEDLSGPPSLTIGNSIVAGNTAPTGPDFNKTSGTVAAVDVNLIGINSTVEVEFPAGELAGTGVAPLDPLLSVLGDYGGPTLTRQPLPGSPALNGGGTVDPGGTDQRGAPRFAGGALNIGSVESQPVVVTTEIDEDNIVPGAGISLREALAGQFVDYISFAPALSGATITLGGSRLLIDRNLTIDASGLADGLTISGNNASRVFEIPAGRAVALESLNVVNGFITPAQDQGGALFNAGTLTIRNSTFSDNASEQYGGAIGNTGTLHLVQCTVANNSSVLDAGGINNRGGSLTLTESTISSNESLGGGGGGGIWSSGTVSLRNSIVAGNLAPTVAPDLSAPLWGGGVTLSGVNLIGDLAGSGLSAGSTLLVGDPLLAPLGDYAGPTSTMRPLPGSPAIDAAGATALLSDQRGLPRPVGSASDLGAVEVQSTALQTLDAAITLRPTLTWSAPNATSAVLYFGTDPATLSSLGTQAPPYTLGAPLGFSTSYYWRVDLTFGGEVITGDVRSFTTRDRGLVVDTAVDENDGVTVGGISLRDAIAEAADSDPAETITFAPALSGTSVGLDWGQLLIDKNLGIDGSALPDGITLSGNDTSRVLEIAAGSTVVLDSLTLTAGDASQGAAIRNEGTLALNRSTISGNSAQEGGGIYNSGGDLTITNTTLAGNVAGVSGGALYHASGTLVLDQVTVSGNTAGAGGGVYLAGGDLALGNSLVADNTAATTGPDLQNEAGSITPSGGNLIGDLADSGLVQGPALMTGAAGLGSLADNGGPTFTMALFPGSPAIDAGGVTTLPTDQRGFERTLAAGPDLGAYETSAGAYNATGLTLYAEIDPALSGSGVLFEISPDPDFLPVVSTLAGTGTIGAGDGERSAAEFKYPNGCAQDAAGNVFIADTGNNRIRMLTPNGVVSTIAGSGDYALLDGPGLSAAFKFPGAITVGPDNDLYVADIYNHCIRKLTRPSIAGQPWVVTTLAGTGSSGFVDGAGSVARFSQPRGLVSDGDGNLYVADSYNHRIRKVSPGGVVTTFAGSGQAGTANNFALAAKFNVPFGLAFDSLGNLFVADRDNHVIRRIDGGNGFVSTFAGQSGVAGMLEGTGAEARFSSPLALAFDEQGNLFVADENNHRIRKVTTPGAVVTTVVGTGAIGFLDGNATVAQFHCPAGLLVDLNQDLIVADAQNHALRRVVLNPVRVAADVAGGGDSLSAVLDAEALGLEPNRTYYVRWRSLLDQSTQSLGQSFVLLEAPFVVTDAASNLTSTSARLNATVDPKDSTTSVVFEYSTDPELAGPLRVSSLVSSGLVSPRGVVVDGSGTTYLADSGAHQVLVIDAGGQLTGSYGSGVAGFADGPGGSAQFDDPSGLALSGNSLFVADEVNHRIRRIDLASGEVTTFAGSGLAGFADGDSASARFLFPTGLAVDSTGHLYVADSGNHRIRRITPAGEVSTAAGSGTPGFADGPSASAQFDTPRAVAVNSSDLVYVADTGNHRMRALTAGGGVITVAGSGTEGFLDAPGTSSRFASPAGVAIDGDDVVYVADRDNHRIRRIATDGEVATLAGSGVSGLKDSPVGELHPATTTEFGLPVAIAADPAGRLVVSEEGNQALRVITRDPLPVVVAPDLAGGGNQSIGVDLPAVLRPGETYYFRAIGTNGRNAPTAGEILSFVTPQSEIVVHDGAGPSGPGVDPGQIINLGATPFDSPVVRTFTIENIGTFELEIAGVMLAAPASGAFTLSGGTGTFTVPPGGTSTFEVTLQGGTAGFYEDEVVITSSDLDEGTSSFTVAGEILAPPVLADLVHRDLTALDLTFGATVNPAGSATEVIFQFSKFPDFEGALEVLTKAGSDQGFANGCGAGARFDTPSDVAVDQFGNLYIADTLNHRIRRITPNGDCNVLAGSGEAGFADGTGAGAQFDGPQGIAIDSAGVLYIADTGNHRIRRITPAGEVTTVAGSGEAAFTDGIVAAARFNQPAGLAVDSTGNLYVADSGNNRVRKIDPSGDVSTLAGPSGLASPQDVAVDGVGNVFVADANNARVRRIDPDLTVTDLPGAGVEFVEPAGVAVDASGNVLVADRGSHRIVRVDPAGQLTVLAGLFNVPGGNDGSGLDARFEGPSGLTASSSGAIYVADRDNHRIRQINPAARTVVAATGITGSDPVPVEVAVGGLEPDTLYYYRAIATNGGGSDFSPLGPTYPTFTTLDNAAALTALTVNGQPVAGFDPCVYSYPLAMAGPPADLVITATAESEAASIQLSENGVFCCELQSGVPSSPLPMRDGPSLFLIEVLSADGTALRTYTLNVTRQPSAFVAWQDENFGSDAGDPAIAGPLADPSGDGVDNLKKYAFGLDPNLNSVAGLPVASPGGNGITLTYTRVLAATDLTYQVEWTTNLVDWSSAGVSEQILSDDGTTQQILAAVPAGSGSRMFVRLALSLQQP